ncbi:MAG TPA: DUF885 family protein, partial [Thermoanaerobaculia bacterium]|nr:DUF885 family protein [Thermoanaerobaculia bacterium]
MRETLVLLLMAVTAGCATAVDSSRELRQIADEVWSRELEGNLSARMRLGLPIETMPDPSYENAAADAASARRVLERLERIDPRSLSEDERLTLGVLRWRQQLAVDGLPHFWHQFPVTPYNSRVREANEALAQFTFRGGADAQRYVRLLAGYARFIDALTAVVTEQRRRGILIPQPELPLVRGMFGGLLQEGDASPFALAGGRLSALSGEERAALMEGVRQAIERQINPALRRLLNVLSSDYESAAPRAVGLAHQPGGSDAYRFLMRLHTSLDLTPEEVHRLGLAEIDRIEHELDGIRRELG